MEIVFKPLIATVSRVQIVYQTVNAMTDCFATVKNSAALAAAVMVTIRALRTVMRMVTIARRLVALKPEVV